MKKLNHIIDVNLKDNSIIVYNTNSEKLKVEFVNLDTYFCHYQNTIECNLYSKLFLNDLKNIRIYIREENKFNLDFHIYEIQIKNMDYTIVKFDSEYSFDFNKPLSIVIGSSGGGTSIVTKFLKYMGVHFGDDSGFFESRKPHESYGLKLWLYGLKEDYPIIHHKDNFLKVVSSYNYKNNKINAFKAPDSHNNINILGEIFPNLKIISVIKKQNNFYNTKEGKIFNELDIIEKYDRQNPYLEGYPIFHLDFDKFFTEYEYVNKVLKFIGVDSMVHNNKQLDSIKFNINFDNRVLNENK